MASARQKATVTAAENVVAVGALAHQVCKATTSPALQSTITSFAEYERTITSTEEMLGKISQGLHDLESSFDDVALALQPSG